MKIPMQLEATVITLIGIIVLHKFGIYGAAISYLLAAIYVAIKYPLTTYKIIKLKTLTLEK